MNLDVLKQWLRNESGAVTVDWVVLTAAVVGLGLASVAAVRTGAVSLGDGIDSSLSDASVAALSTLGAGAQSNVRTLLNVTQETFDSWVEYVADYTDETIAFEFANFANNAAAAIESGNAELAAYYIDATALYSQELTSRGLDLPDGVATVGELENAYHNMV